MSWPASPAWLLELQASFGAMLRTPLDRSKGTLRAQVEAYDPALLAATRSSTELPACERLAVYHRQYWYRLFTVLQGLYPLTARLVGYWQFNELATRHLSAHPPRGFDIDTIGEGFAEDVASYLPVDGVLVAEQRRVDSAVVLEAAKIDAAFYRVTRAARQEPFRPGPADAARLASSRFVLLPGVALLSEHWPLSELRLSLIEHQADKLELLGPRQVAARDWLLIRQQTKLGLLPLEALEARLLALVQHQPLESALSLLEAGLSEAEREGLPERIQAWLARSVRLGIWSDLK